MASRAKRYQQSHRKAPAHAAHFQSPSCRARVHGLLGIGQLTKWAGAIGYFVLKK